MTRLHLIDYIGERYEFYGRVEQFISKRRGRHSVLLTDVHYIDGTWLTDHLWVDVPQNGEYRVSSILYFTGRARPYQRSNGTQDIGIRHVRDTKLYPLLIDLIRKRNLQ